jgi:oligoribonuclease NrnB/cAMP/cGMP phosphodiesterase (DHH superfamily)
MQKLYHLSHIDLDGYTAQFISSKYFEERAYYNSNYGDEITFMLEHMLGLISQEKQESLLLITDLNLNFDQCKMLEEEVSNLNGRGIKVELQLLDHHKSGQASADVYGWYFLDNARSATKITYDWFVNRYGNKLNEDEVTFVNAVNAADIWLEHDPLFEFGKVGLNLISGSKEVNRYMFNKESFEYLMYLIDEAVKLVGQEDSHIKLDDAIHFLKKAYLNVNGNPDTLENLKSHYLTDLLGKKQDELTIEYKGYRGLLTFAIGHTSVLANQFLRANPHFDFFLDVGLRGKVSLRANNKVDVAQISKELFNGGGHANASGGKFEKFRDSFDYYDVKQQVEDHILSSI